MAIYAITSPGTRQLRLPLSRANADEFARVLLNLRRLSLALAALNAIARRTLGAAHCEALALQLANLEATADILETRFDEIDLAMAPDHVPDLGAARLSPALPTLDFIDRIAERVGDTRRQLRAAAQIAEDLDDRDTRRLLRICLGQLVIAGWIVAGIRREYARRARDLAELCFSTVARHRSDASAGRATRH